MRGVGQVEGELLGLGEAGAGSRGPSPSRALRQHRRGGRPSRRAVVPLAGASTRAGADDRGGPSRLDPTASGMPASAQPGSIRHPTFRQVERTVEQRPAMTAGIGQKPPDLAVLDPPCRAAVLPLHPGRLGALLDEAGLVEHQHGPRVAEMRGDLGPQIVRTASASSAPGSGTPAPRPASVPGRLRQLPPLIALRSSTPPAPAAHADRPRRRRGSTAERGPTVPATLRTQPPTPSRLPCRH